MSWNWEKKNWPNFSYNKSKLEKLEIEYASVAGNFKGTFKVFEKDQKNEIIVELLSNEGIKTSEIEGELLNRDSVQSSIRKKLGLIKKAKKSEPSETGVAEMMISLYKNYQKPLSHEELHHWNKELMKSRKDLENIGKYRTHEDPMQIISGPFGKEKIHFQAPPSKKVRAEMEKFIVWFNNSEKELPPLTRAGIAHLYSVCIHPYEDGNGRMARALAEKSLSQSLQTPTLSGLSEQINSKRKKYYDFLEENNKSLEITDWLVYFGQTIILGQKYNLHLLEKTLKKAKIFRDYGTKLNERQKKVITKLFAFEPTGFSGGLSAENYIAITKTSRATATRDLQYLTNMAILIKKGERKYTRYYLK